MPTKRTILGAAAVVAGLAGGGAAGALLGVPTTSLAQTGTTSDEPDGGGDGSIGERRFGPGGHGFGFRALDLDVAAEALGMGEDELRDALEDGGSIASVAEERGVDVQTVVDALVEAAGARLDERVAELREALPERMAELVEREGGAVRPGFLPGPRRGLGLLDRDAAAEALGISEDDLRDALEDGDSIADVAEARGVDVQVVVDALVAAAEAELDDEVADGDLTEEQAADLREDLPERMAEVVEHERGSGSRWGGHGPGRRGGPGPGGFGGPGGGS